MSKIYLPVPNDFNYKASIQHLQRSPKELLHRVEDTQIVKLLKWQHEKMLVRIREGKEKIVLEFLNGTPSKEAKDFTKTFVQEWLDLQTDLEPFYAITKHDPLLKEIVKKFYGYRIIGQPDLFESIVWAILGQQINLQFAYTLKHRFVEHFGERLFWNNDSYFLFPTPQLVATLNDAVLLPLQFSRQKSRYTISIAEAFAAETITKEKLRGLPLQEAKEQLMKIKGIGNWTANYALMKTFRYPDAFPLEDAGIHNAIKKLKKMDRKPTLEEVKKVFKKYKGWEAYATVYLWKSL